ncbi:hypothetical protein U91I_00550 [alpha proteobacterium U9-1i]|nr:hypothetical protein U91I_00550 [alpha proteobacterium U9-1i]
MGLLANSVSARCITSLRLGVMGVSEYTVAPPICVWYGNASKRGAYAMLHTEITAAIVAVRKAIR